MTRAPAVPEVDPSVVLEQHGDLAPLQGDWTTLGRTSGSPFCSWQWASTWWQHFGRGRPLVIGVARRPDGTARCILPVFRAAQLPLRVLRFVGHEGGDEMGPVCRRGDEAFAAAALRRFLASLPDWDVFVADRMPAEHGTVAGLRGAVLSTDTSPLIQNAGGWTPYLAAQSRNMRQNTRRARRRLETAHHVAYRLASPETLTADIATLFRLHEARWTAPTPFLDLRDFHEDFMQVAASEGWLRLWLLELDGRPVAAWYGLRFADQEWYYQAGRDPTLEHVSPGAVLLAHSIATSLDDGVRAYRLLRGGEDYKQHFATDFPLLETVAVGHGLRGGAAVGCLRALLRSDQGRRLLRRAGRLL